MPDRSDGGRGKGQESRSGSCIPFKHSRKASKNNHSFDLPMSFIIMERPTPHMHAVVALERPIDEEKRKSNCNQRWTYVMASDDKTLIGPGSRPPIRTWSCQVGRAESSYPWPPTSILAVVGSLTTLQGYMATALGGYSRESWLDL